ncbi:hypothetical protein F5X96DRAFT_637869 [Biscogniauxia mediterranea]|nr:hypothetical protein F5X96DRAFT_637869 [Biscogniauxia mediterranea]
MHATHTLLVVSCVGVFLFSFSFWWWVVVVVSIETHQTSRNTVSFGFDNKPALDVFGGVYHLGHFFGFSFAVCNHVRRTLV